MKDKSDLITTVITTVITPTTHTVQRTSVPTSTVTNIEFVYEILKSYPTTSVIVVLGLGIIIYFMTTAPTADVILPGPVTQGPIEQIPVTQEPLTQVPEREAIPPFVFPPGRFTEEQLDSERSERSLLAF